MSYIGNQSSNKIVSDVDIQDQSISTAKLATPINLYNHGQCKLAKDGSNLKLSRFNGKNIVINGSVWEIPLAGITLSAAGLSASTLYYIYVYQTAGTLTLEASTTAYTADTNTGIMIKNGDASRTLVGMARPITGPAWQDTATQRFVRSWFNRDIPTMYSKFTANRTTGSTTPTELNTEIRVEALTWNGEIVQASWNGIAQHSNGGGILLSSIGIDSTTVVEDVVIYAQIPGIAQAVGVPIAQSYSYNKAGLSEGYHYFTVLNWTSSATATWIGGPTSPSGCTFTVAILNN